ncbi:MAG: hypothetical protein JJLCMIEE_02389 [Acidimicrobiales bacterium]|nr:MAG: hypothetical protein EDR02_15935 [Actinomycetota bacterium]MBV6509320.1 hypothetical protein [Acidimicrobiales bacterium]RIK03955.1 MAG: hypothetical protein DCC48_14715 [Acidobacteriota bacterium]
MLWLLRAGWLSLPFTAGAVVSDGLEGRSTAVAAVLASAVWIAWGVTLLATLVPHAMTLTVVRSFAPAAALATALAAVAEGSIGLLGAVGLASVAAVNAIAFTPLVGEAFVDASSYGTERRMPLRAPLAVLLGPVELVWALGLAGLVAGPVLLAGRHWALGAVLTPVGLGIAFAAARSLHSLSRRWVVFVPAGLVLHDPLSLVDPVLFTRQHIAHLGPAAPGSRAVDLGLHTRGLSLEMRLVEKTKLPRRRPGRPEHTELANAVLFAPSRPSALLAEARHRHIPT